ncbi:MAG: hypothetical protein D6731_18970 [Planctomycetota bacterium]|nr:MAG: hypothetical protein D6731_18970 [Planctomycetota bacterium]
MTAADSAPHDPAPARDDAAAGEGATVDEGSSSPPPGRRRGRWRLRLLALGLGLAFGLFLGELGARVLGLGATTLTRGALHVYDPEVGWRCTSKLDARYQKPGSFDVRIRCNARGLRDLEDHPYAKPPGERRVVVLGDSAMWGWGLENDETFAARLEAELPETECLNLAANGYSAVQSLIRLETEGVRYEPDAVVYAFVANDLEDNFDDKKGGRPVAELGPDGGLRIVNRPVRRRWKPAYKQWLRHHSRLFGLLEFSTARLKVYLRTRAAARAQADADAARQAAAKAYWHKIESRRAKGRIVLSALDLYGTPGEVVEHAWRTQRAVLAAMRERARAAGARLVVVFVTGRAEVDRAIFRETIARYGLDPGDPALGLDWDRPRRRLAALCRELGLAFVDPTEAFRATGAVDALFLRNDGHWSPRGARLAAAQAAPVVRSLLPGS